VNKVRRLEKRTDSFEDPRDKRATGESGSLANEPCDPVGQADCDPLTVREIVSQCKTSTLVEDSGISRHLELPFEKSLLAEQESQ